MSDEASAHTVAVVFSTAFSRSLSDIDRIDDDHDFLGYRLIGSLRLLCRATRDAVDASVTGIRVGG